MNEATVIYPHQLFANSPALKMGRRIFLVEEPLILSYNPIHNQKLVLHKLSMDAYEQRLTKEGYKVNRLTIEEFPSTKEVFTYLKTEGVQALHIVDTTDCYLERAITASKIHRIWYESPLFILTKEDAVTRYKSAKKNMARFYKKIRQDKNILMEGQ